MCCNSMFLNFSMCMISIVWQRSIDFTFLICMHVYLSFGKCEYDFWAASNTLNTFTDST